VLVVPSADRRRKPTGRRCYCLRTADIHPLNGKIGDALFAVLSTGGHNIRKILVHLRAWLAWISAALTCPPRVETVGTRAAPGQA
jgi:hypothetical protein